jgi:hypothetical protein
MKTVKVVLAASTFIGASLIGLILAVSSHVGAAITSMQASSAASNPFVMSRERAKARVVSTTRARAIGTAAAAAAPASTLGS